MNSIEISGVSVDMQLEGMIMWGMLYTSFICFLVFCFFFFKQKTAYEIGTGDWSSDVCSSDLRFPI